MFCYESSRTDVFFIDSKAMQLCGIKNLNKSEQCDYVSFGYLSDLLTMSDVKESVEELQPDIDLDVFGILYGFVKNKEDLL